MYIRCAIIVYERRENKMYWAGKPNQAIHRDYSGKCYDESRPHTDDRVVVKGVSIPMGYNAVRKHRENAISATLTGLMTLTVVVMSMMSMAGQI